MNALVIEYYEANQKLGIDLSLSSMQKIYENAKQYIGSEYTKNDTYAVLLHNVNTDSDITTYFDNHKTKELVPE
ncbi:MAG: hypothetical protein WCI00_09325 [bacterium]